MVDRATGRISLSPQFENRIQDIASWTMTTDFFSYFPEMYGDIPSFESSPCRQLPTHHFGSLDRHVRGEEPDSSSALSQEADSYSCSRPPYSKKQDKDLTNSFTRGETLIVFCSQRCLWGNLVF
ncbi:hypothetical protein BKA60DRAFT_310271 [Fusarium oxysporum]|nr:hypothetical protein BKA60DRAFT_310271 [Fusarium oxysporum]